ncbi:WhiB family transcriptional regulator [Streptomyces sp. NBC_01198]|uniref:WhiB family transcriptional regulator n=1 Tax=Streptomyces sp. NBC_01198 TaxID=2903769 RepID=UPI003FA3810F
MDDAACAGKDPEVFFPVSESGAGLRQIAEAKHICARCPVAEACLDWALRTRQPDGVWGGMSTGERHAVRRPGRRARTTRGRAARRATAAR